MKGLIGVIILIVVLGGGYVWWMNIQEKDGDMNPQGQMETQSDDTMMEKDAMMEEPEGAMDEEAMMEESANYTLAEVSEHATADDCWMAIDGKVYDVTEFVSSHPGGEAILEGCGKDATTLYETRPMGSGTPHSEQAREGLDNFYIGDLEG